MARVTSKLQITLPKALAERFGISPGDEFEWEAAGDVIRIVPARAPRPEVSIEDRLRRFDRAEKRQRKRERDGPAPAPSEARGWTRDELYRRGRSR
jgi:AbrB family looped-hinge helix DNA binding protein